ncbi:MAG TPA: MarR family transcriptional regulator [Gaiellaceae bacterium]|nr:MarR family transcriptional regulator [Gaiellaceae bacterium]
MPADRTDTGYLLALASRRWNEILEQRFAEAGFSEVRASYGALLIPLFEEDGLRLGELARRARLSKQTVTTMSRLLERDGLVTRQPDPADARATRLFLTERARKFRQVAGSVLSELDRQVADRLGDRPAAQLRQALAALAELAAYSTSSSST